jgi:cytochrome bd-type quinol oxidase subunit 2
MTKDDESKHSSRARWLRRTAWFLALSYGIGAPLAAVLEVRRHVLSQRFDYPPALILGVCVLQLGCAFAVFGRRLAPWAAAALTLTTLGAIVSHIRIGSPWTALPAVFFTIVQVWFGVVSQKGSPPS